MGEVGGAGAGEEGLCGVGFVVGVGPRPGGPDILVPVEGDFGVDAFGEVDAVGVVFGGGEDDFVFVDVAGVDVDGSGDLAKGELFGKEGFEHIGFEFAFGEMLGAEEGFEADPLAEEGGAHFGVVEVGKGEGEDLGLVVDFAVPLGEFEACGGEFFGSAGEEAGEASDGER